MISVITIIDIFSEKARHDLTLSIDNIFKYTMILVSLSLFRKSFLF